MKIEVDAVLLSCRSYSAKDKKTGADKGIAYQYDFSADNKVFSMTGKENHEHAVSDLASGLTKPGKLALVLDVFDGKLYLKFGGFRVV